MTAKIIKDNTLPSTWKRIITGEHKYIGSQHSNTRSIKTDIYHSDDCTLNNRVFLFTVDGGIEKAKVAVGQYESELAQIKAASKKINEFVETEIAQ